MADKSGHEICMAPLTPQSFEQLKLLRNLAPQCKAIQYTESAANIFKQQTHQKLPQPSKAVMARARMEMNSELRTSLFQYDLTIGGSQVVGVGVVTPPLSGRLF